MALMQCGECGKEISDKAAACPNCGAPVAPRPDEPVVVYNPKQDQFMTRNRGCGEVLIWALLIFMVIAGLSTCLSR